MLNNKSQIKTMQIYFTQQKLKYFYCSGSNKINNVIVLIHGISRNAETIIESFSKTIDVNTLLIAPLFSKEYATDYQRLGRKNKGPRADYMLQAIVNELRNKFKFTTKKINLFGFSAGAQFAHRFAFAHPNAVNKVALVAAGWYTLPSAQLKYPLGLKLNGEFTDITFEQQRLLRTQFRVFIGEKDNLRDKALNKNRHIDAIQGRNRIERANNWIISMMNQCHKLNIINPINLIKLPNVYHDFNDANSQAQISQLVTQWFTEGSQQ